MCAHTADIVLLLLLCEFTQQNSHSHSRASDPVTVGPEEINIALLGV